MSTIFLTIANPNPFPLSEVLVFENRLNNDSDFIDEAVPVFEIVSLLFVI